MPTGTAGSALLSTTMVGFTLAALSCDDGAVEPAPPPAPAATTVAVNPASATLASVGETARLIAEVRDQNGQVMAGAAVTWASSDASVAAVDASGLVTAAANGITTITATSGSASGTAAVTVARVVSSDRAVLVALYEATDGPNWANNNGWLTDAPLDDWYGVATDSAGRVVSLALAGEWDEELSQWVRPNLAGPIPPELAGLTHLEVLNLRYSGVTGAIPPELGNLPNLKQLDLGWNTGLSGPIPPELGDLASLERLELGDNQGMSGPLPPDLGRLSNLEELVLQDIPLSGSVPPELGDLTSLTFLDLNETGLSGVLPASFAGLDRLRRLLINHTTGLCVPGTAEFVDWTAEREVFGPWCNDADFDALSTLYDKARGDGWPNRGGWLADRALGRWYGVAADSVGRVLEIDLSGNGLAGQLPANLGQLERMTDLRVADNAALVGRLPGSLAGLSLRALHYAGTVLCVPSDGPFQRWLGTVASHQGTGKSCATPSDREILEALYDATGGPNWVSSENWLTSRPLGEWSGVEVNESGHVSTIALRRNNLAGLIPPELGSLAGLVDLSLSSNDLTGPIPSELGNLAELRDLELAGNNLTGSIPPSLGNLDGFKWLRLEDNGLTGSIPPSLDNLHRLLVLNLEGNGLPGSIPAELGSLANLLQLDLGYNDLTGPVPAELGSLSKLESLSLTDNALSGPVPVEFAGLASLSALHLRRNAGMTGTLPNGLTALGNLEEILLEGTGLCAPSDQAFLDWLSRIPKRRVVHCRNDAPAAYLTQAVQSREFPVPLVAGKKALLRVFPTARGANTAGIPPVRARFYLGSSEVHAVDIPGKPGPIPTEVDEGSLPKSANAEIPGSVIQSGLEMVIDVDPEGTLDTGLGVSRRIPEAGRLAVDARSLPILDLTVIPFLWTERPDSSILQIVAAMAADPEANGRLRETRTLLPVGGFQVTAHESVLSSSNNGHDLLRETEAIRVLEGAEGHYMGTIANGRGPLGVGNQGGRSSYAQPRGWIMAHELGHNFNLGHAPCRTLGEPSYPYTDGAIGAWGYDFDNGRLLSPRWWDLMSYCSPRWISDYSFTNALHFRLLDEGGRAAQSAAPTQALLLWGGVGADGIPFLNPAFVVGAPPTLPDSTGNYRIIGAADDGTHLFVLSFGLPEIADADGSPSFAFVMPARQGWERSLASITVVGPGGSFTLDGSNDVPMTILRNPDTGQVRGILRNPPSAIQVAADARGGVGGPGLQVLFSRGVPDEAAWWR